MGRSGRGAMFDSEPIVTSSPIGGALLDPHVVADVTGATDDGAFDQRAALT